jgi:uncharacterized protein YecE (DUF72 family)
LPSTDKIRIGCSGWSYKDWLGTFYPNDLPARDYLKFYSKAFDCVEIDSSFYRVPLPTIVEQWRRITPDDFLFTAKFPKKITHDNKLENFEPYLARFYSVMSKFEDKLGPLIVQLPPSIKLDKHRNVLENFLSKLDPKFKHAIEFRHKSWFTSETYQMLSRYNIAMAWSLNQYVETPAETTANFVYLRMVGERDITQFTGIQKDRSVEMKEWANKLEKKNTVYDGAFIFFNNHFAGFGPESVNEFRRLLGMMEIDWKHLAKTGRQGSLSEF